MPKQPPKTEHVNPLLAPTTEQGFGPPSGWGQTEEEVKRAERQIQSPTSEPEFPPLLYQSLPSPEYLARPFDRKYDKQAANVNPYLAGALETIAKDLKQNKTEQYEEMMRDYIEKHKEILERRPEVVRFNEEKWKAKHRL